MAGICSLVAPRSGHTAPSSVCRGTEPHPIPLDLCIVKTQLRSEQPIIQIKCYFTQNGGGGLHTFNHVLEIRVLIKKKAVDYCITSLTLKTGLKGNPNHCEL